MPYYIFHNMTDPDLDAMVAYLRTIPGVDHTVTPRQSPFDVVPAASPPLDMTTVPTPGMSDPNRESALRGRYLAAQVGLCLECHTQKNMPGPGPVLDASKYFAGGEDFGGIVPSPPFPMNIYSANLTSHPTGLGGMWTAPQIVRALKMGLDKDGHGICPPMPVGMEAYGGLTDTDATDIANYILSLPPIMQMNANQCMVPGT
jgi:mono/diheme cytochrome c family protein